MHFLCYPFAGAQPVAAGTRMSIVFAKSDETAQLRRLEELLPRWLRETPLYRGLAPQIGGLAGSGRVLDLLHRFPFITKQDIRRDFPRNFLPDGVELETLLEMDLVELEHTSGTSEPRTPLLLGRGWWAAQEERALRLNRLVSQVLDEFPEARRVTLSSPVCSGDICYTGVPSRSDRVVGNALFVNLSRHPFLWSAADLARMAAETIEWQPQFLDVDPVYGVLFARYCELEGIRLPSLQFVLSSYEYLSVTHRRVMERAFGVPVFNLYGSTETGHLLMEDERGLLRPSLDTAFLECLEPAVGGVAELIVTTLSNQFMPLIRYRIGDLVERVDDEAGPAYRVHGRRADGVVRPDGQQVTLRQIDQCFAGLQGVAHYQLTQLPENGWRLRMIEDAPLAPASELEELRSRLALQLGCSELEIQAVDSLLAENSGKFRLVCP